MIYAGLMVEGEAIVFEFNVRFGDRKPRPSSPCASRTCCRCWPLPQTAICTAGRWSGTPGCGLRGHTPVVTQIYEQGFPISGLDSAIQDERVTIFHAGTAFKHGNIVTAGGVLGVTRWDDDLQSAVAKVYATLLRINFRLLLPA